MNEAMSGMSADEFRRLAELAARKEALTTELIAVNSEMSRMMSGDAPVRVPRDKNRGEKIIEVIKAAGPDGIGYDALAARVGASAPTVNTWLIQHAREWPALAQIKDGRRVRWCWKPDFKVTEPPKPAEAAR